MATTILYIGHDNIDPVIKEMCLRKLYEASGDIPVVERHQPTDWPLSGVSMYRNIISGLDEIKTEHVAIAEHDCLYTNEHFSFVPPDEHFWYNDNCWLLQYKNPNHPEQDGVFSYWANRRVQSQLICKVDRFRESCEVAMTICEDPLWNEVRHSMGVGEPGTVDYNKAMRLTRGSKKQQLRNRIKDYIVGFNARDFKTVQPNVDIRWGGNFTGPRRGKNKTFELSPWGTMEHIMVK